MNRSPYWLGFATQSSEIDVEDLQIRGTLPPWLDGVLLRTAPARYEVGNDSYTHWFDGLAMLHRFRFMDGRASYSNRFLRSRSYVEASNERRISRPEFATMPRFTMLERLASWIRPVLTDNCNVSVNKIADDVAVFTETPQPIIFDADTLAVSRHYSYPNRIRGALSIAHPHVDRQRRCHYTYVVEFGRKSRYHILRIDALTGQPSVVTSLTATTPAYMHSFGMSERFLVVTEFPLVVNPLRLRFSGVPFIRNYRWQPQLGTRFHVIDKDTGRVVRSTQARAMFAFHHVNAFEMGDDIIVDMVVFADASVIDELYLDRLRSQPVAVTGKLTRFRIRPRGDVQEEALSQVGMELPRIHYGAHAGRPYRYVYAAGNEVPGNFFDKLVKSDLLRGQDRSWREPQCYPGEPVFVARPGAANEEDGVVLSVVLDAAREASFLLIADAATLEERARIELPHVITFGFHGNFFPQLTGPESFRDLHR